MEEGTIRREVEELKAADAKDVHRAVREEGEEELARPAASLLWSGLAAGFAINASLVAEGVLEGLIPDVPWRTLVVSLGYPIGFLLVVLGRMQFFTESTITVMLPLAAHPSWWAARRTLRLWGLVLAANVVGTAIVAAALAYLPLVDDAVREGMVEVSATLLSKPPATIFWTAVPAGFLIAALAWALPNAREQAFLVVFGVTWVVGAAGFSHSVLGSAEAFLLVFSGRTGIGHALAGMILPAVAGNLVGGAGLFTMLAHGQVHSEMRDDDGGEQGPDEEAAQGDEARQDRDSGEGGEARA